jgi:hypothetical protein
VNTTACLRGFTTFGGATLTTTGGECPVCTTGREAEDSRAVGGAAVAWGVAVAVAVALAVTVWTFGGVEVATITRGG